MIESLFSADVMTVEAVPGDWDAPLSPAEEVCVRRAVSKRRREFAAGRACARRALAGVGIEGWPLIAGPDRFPIWPEGVVGSITHCEGFCGVAVARRETLAGVGLDAERIDPLDESMVRVICNESELAQVDLLLGAGAGSLAKILFSAKESVYKAYYPIGRRILEFHDVEIDLAPNDLAFTARFAAGAGAPPGLGTLTGRYAVTPTHVLCGVEIRSRPIPPFSSSG